MTNEPDKRPRERLRRARDRYGIVRTMTESQAKVERRSRARLRKRVDGESGAILGNSSRRDQEGRLIMRSLPKPVDVSRDAAIEALGRVFGPEQYAAGLQRLIASRDERVSAKALALYQKVMGWESSEVRHTVDTTPSTNFASLTGGEVARTGRLVPGEKPDDQAPQLDAGDDQA